MSRRRKALKLKIRPETVHSIVAVVLMVLGVLVIISFTGQGIVLATMNQFLMTHLGIAMLFLPFVFISAGLVMLQTKWAWSKPHVLLGALFLMTGILGVGQSGTVGEATFRNVALLLTPAGSYSVFGAAAIIGFLIMLQLSMREILEGVSNWWQLRQLARAQRAAARAAAQDDYVRDEHVAQAPLKARGFQIPRLTLPFGKWLGGSAANSGNTALADGSDGAGGDGALGTQAAAGSSGHGPGGAGTGGPGGLAGAGVGMGMAGAAGLTGANALAAAAAGTGSRNLARAGFSQANLDGTHTTVPDSAQLVWEYPPLSLLSSSKGAEADRGDVKSNAQVIENTLDSFGIKARVAEVNYGPSVTQYALEITRGTKLSKITTLSTDLALALAAPTGQIRIEAPIAGRSLVGIEVPNHSAQYVTLRAMLHADAMKKHKSKLAVALGIDVAGNHVIADIARMPHVLIAGATGSGKSVAVNAFLCSILFRASPAEVKFILVDPKRVELTVYNDIPHLLTPVIVEPNKVVSALKWATVEMDNRYKKLAEVGVKNIDAYNELAGFAAMPSLVIVIDELADIMLFAPSEVEEAVTRIAQMARAVGIHLVLATQRPSVDVITGLIKANIPTRIAFNVSSMTDSRVILDQPGAEKLLGRGDMLYVPPDQAKPSRIQGTYVSDQEIRGLIEFIKNQGQQPEYQEEITVKYKPTVIKGGSGGVDGEDRDDLFLESVKLFSQYDKASSSLIQRRLSVGYARAARILDQLYAAGMVGPAEGSKPRDVVHTKIREYLTTASPE